MHSNPQSPIDPPSHDAPCPIHALSARQRAHARPTRRCVDTATAHRFLPAAGTNHGTETPKSNALRQCNLGYHCQRPMIKTIGSSSWANLRMQVTQAARTVSMHRQPSHEVDPMFAENRYGYFTPHIHASVHRRLLCRHGVPSARIVRTTGAALLPSAGQPRSACPVARSSQVASSDLG